MNVLTYVLPKVFVVVIAIAPRPWMQNFFLLSTKINLLMP